jgi:hypothetical protein
VQNKNQSNYYGWPIKVSAFKVSANGAQASATLYSIIETAKANGLVPYDYLNYLLSEIPTLQPGHSITHLLPWVFAKH